MHVERETDVSHCFFVTCNHVCCVSSLLSHNDDLHPCETLSVQSYEICDSPSITVIKTAVCGMISISTIPVLAPTIDHNSVRGYVEVSFGVALFSWCCVCVCKRKNAKHQVPLCYCITTLGVGTAW